MEKLTKNIIPMGCAEIRTVHMIFFYVKTAKKLLTVNWMLNLPLYNNNLLMMFQNNYNFKVLLKNTTK